MRSGDVTDDVTVAIVEEGDVWAVIGAVCFLVLLLVEVVVADVPVAILPIELHPEPAEAVVHRLVRVP